MQTLKVCISAFLFGILVLAPGCSGPQERGVGDFQVTHVTLYDCGLAQVERQARVSGGERLAINLELAHLDDLLASLFLATDGGVKVQGVRFPSVRNLTQAASGSGFGKALMEDDSDTVKVPETVRELAEALRGMPATINRVDGSRLSGTIVGVSGGVPPEQEGAPIPAERLMVVLESGGLAWVPMAEVASVIPRSEREARAMENLANQMGQSNGFGEVQVVVETTEDSDGRLAAGYIRQIPVWRMVYKTSVTDESVSLEAWAIVHNDTGEDWKDVQLTLLSGLPESYIMSLATPRYGQRELAWLAPDLLMRPVLGADTPDSLLYRNLETMTLGSSGYITSSGYGSSFGGGGGSASLGSFTMSGPREMSSSLLQLGEAAAKPGAEAEVSREISTYQAISRTSIPKDSSSMVPLIRRDLPGLAFTAIDLESDAVTCVLMRNQTGLVLQPGMSSFMIDGRFRGQAEVSRTEPGDRRLLCFGKDQDVTFSSSSDQTDAAVALEFKNEVLWLHGIRRTTKTYSIENMAGQDRRLGINIPSSPNMRILTDGRLEDGEDGSRVLVISAPARKKFEQQVIVETGVMSSVELGSKALRGLLDLAIPPKNKEVVNAALVFLDREQELRSKAAAKRKELDRMTMEAEQLRQNLGLVPQAAAQSRVVETMLKDLISLEKKCLAIRDEIDSINQSADQEVAQARESLRVLRP